MTVTSLICTYLYGSLAIVRAALEGYTKMAKNLLKAIDKLAQAAMFICRYTIDIAIDTTIKLVKQYEKELFDMLYEWIFGTDKSFWCNRLWKCLALLNELLDPNSYLFRKLSEWWNNQCFSDAQGNLLNNIRDIISDFLKFQQIICSAGFTVEFGISYIKSLLGWCKEQMEAYLSWVERKIKSLKLALEGYLNTVIDWGVLDYLEKLLSFFTCIFDDASCSEIATASNFYKDTMAKLKLQKDGDGYTVSAEYKKSTYGELEGAATRLKNLTMEIDKASKMCIDPNKLDKANKAFNLSENLLPRNADGSIGWNKMIRGDFSSAPICQYFSMTADKLLDAISLAKAGGETGFPDNIPYNQIDKNTRIEPDGTVWYKAKCNWVKLPYDKIDPEKPTITEVYTTIDVPKGVMMHGHNIVTVGAAALEIKTNPDSDFSQECKELHDFVVSWQRNTGAAKRYGEQLL